MVPGPTAVPEAILRAYQINYGSADLEEEYLDLYNQVEYKLQQLFQTQNQIVIQSGEGMLALWSALKSCLKPGDKVLSISTGVFGEGIGFMARSLGAQVDFVNFGFDQTIDNLEIIETKIKEFQPKMITAVHCETPSGTLNPLAGLGELKKRYQVPLLYVDAVASVGGTPIQVDEFNIDLCLGGSQKVLSCPPDMSFLSVSPAAWEIAKAVAYEGYDALLPFKEAQKKAYFPYTPNWGGTAALNAGATLLLKEGLEAVYSRHNRAAQLCRQGLQSLGLTIFPKPEAVSSPTVTAACVPAHFTWPEFDQALRAAGLVVGGSYGPMAGKVFRLGHMGSQAKPELVQKALDVIQAVIARR
jgi:aspartate aminotransferase-like enzyme